MKVWNVQQGTPEWLALRRRIYRTASAAPIMMGVSKKMSRSELIRLVATGDEKEFSEWVRKNLLEKGHEIEAAIRPHIETQLIGEDLYPITASDDSEYILLSADGITEEYRRGWECKSWNEEKAAQVRDDIVPDEDRWQVVQSLVITRADDWTYTVSDGTEDRTISTVYRLQDGDERALLAGWKQFDEDVANYVHVERAPAPVAAPVLELPPVSVKVSGAIDIADNFKVFETALRDFIDNRLIRKPETDQDFADLDTQIKTLKKAEDALVAAESAVVSQVASIDAMKRTKDMLYKLTRDNRLMAEKLLEAEKTRRRVEIQEGGKKAFADHIAALNARLGKPYMPPIPADFVGVTKNKRSIASLQDAVSTELARAKIAANEVADRIDLNLKTLREQATDHAFLFADTAQLVLKANEDVVNVIKARIAEHKEAEAKRLEQEREKIRQEEEAKAKAEQERIRREEEEKARAEAASAATTTEAAQVTSIASPVVEPVATTVQVERSSAPVFAASAARKPTEAPAIPQDPVYLYTAEASGNRVVVTFEAGRESLTIEEAKRLRSHLGAAILTAEAAA